MRKKVNSQKVLKKERAGRRPKAQSRQKDRVERSKKKNKKKLSKSPGRKTVGNVRVSRDRVHRHDRLLLRPMKATQPERSSRVHAEVSMLAPDFVLPSQIQSSPMYRRSPEAELYMAVLYSAVSDLHAMRNHRDSDVYRNAVDWFYGIEAPLSFDEVAAVCGVDQEWFLNQLRRRGLLPSPVEWGRGHGRGKNAGANCAA